LFKEDAEVYSRFRERILHLETFAAHIGWGYGDYLREQVYLLEGELGKEAP
jgi:hypothetical protein